MPSIVPSSSCYCGATAYPSRDPAAFQGSVTNRNVLALPEVVGVYFHVVKNDAGNSPGTSIDSVLQKFELMRDLYSPHGICFLLAGIGEIHNSDLDTQYYESEESELAPYLKPDLLNIFIHDYLASEPGGSTAGGWAYDIPNTYFSWWELSVIDTNATSVVAHETGHCFGLYHTHDSSQGEENVDRSGGCENCATSGDLLCDTQADPNLATNGYMSGCSYVGTVTDNCNDPYIPDPSNVMSYSLGSCQTNFSGGQGLRSLSFLYGSLSNLVVPLNRTLIQNVTYSTGEYFHMAEENVTFSASNLSFTGAAILRSAAGNSVNVLPGTTFSPGSGFTVLSAQSTCD